MNLTAQPAFAPTAPAPAATHGPVILKIPDVQVVPARLIEQPSPPRPAPAPPSHALEMAQKRKELKERAFAFLREIATGGIMPTVAEYDERKPADLLDGKNLLNSLGYMSWQDVAQDVELKWSGRGRVPAPKKRGRPRKS